MMRSGATLSVQSWLTNFAGRSTFLDDLRSAFGEDISIPQALELQNQWRNGDFIDFPKVELRPSDELEGALGAYAASTDTIYFNEDFYLNASLESVVAVFLEEIGHSIDARLNTQDTPGDEGEIFSALVRNHTLTAVQLTTLQSQDDTAILTLDGRQVPVEMASLLGEEVTVDVRFSTWPDNSGPISVSLYSITFTVGAGQEVSAQPISYTFQSGGFSQTFSGNVSIDVGADTLFTNFNGTAQPNGLQFVFSSLVGESISSIASANQTSQSGVTNGVNSTRPPSISDNSVTTGFNLLGFQPGTNISQTVQLGFGSGNQAPSFNDGAVTTLTVGEDSVTNSIINLLDITDTDTGNTLTWSVLGNPSNGSLGGFNTSRTSNGGIVTPAGLTYTPGANFSGTDSFIIQVNDGTDTDSITVNVTVNNAPEVSSISPSGATPTNANSLQFDVVFSENVTGVDSDDFVISTTGTSNGNIASVAGSGSTYTVTVNNVTGDGTVGLNLVDNDSITNGTSTTLGGVGTSGNGNGNFTGQTYTIDNTAPTVTVNIVDASLNDGDNSSLVTFEFSEAVSGFAEGDLTVSGGTLSAFTMVDGDRYTATFTANDGVNTTGSVAVNTNSYTDLAGNNGAANSDSVTIETVNPTVTVNIVDASLNDGDNSSLVTFEFSEAVSNFAEEDLTVSGGTLSAFTMVTADSYTATFTADDNSTTSGSIAVNDNSYTNAAGNLGTTGSDTVTVDTQNPTVTVDIVDASLNDGDNSSLVTFEFSEAVSNFAEEDLTVSGGTLSAFTMVNADSYTAIFTAAADSTTPGSVIVNANSYTDAVENLGASGDDTVTIATASAIAFSAASYSSNEGIGTSNAVMLTRTGDISGTSTVQVNITGGTATDGDTDYTSIGFPLIVTFAANEASKTVALPIVDDNLYEPGGDETITFSLSAASNADIGAQSTATLNIVDNDAQPTVTLGLVGSPLAEDGGIATVTATLSNPSTQAVTIDLGFTGTAMGSGTDYTASNTQIVIPANATTGSITLTGNSDALDEINETIIVDITSVTNGTESGTQQVSAIITDDDLPPNVTLSIGGDLSENAGSTQLTATLDAISSQDVTIDLTYTGTAINGTDYTGATSILIPAGSLSQTIDLTGTDDFSAEGNETITIDIDAVTNGTESGVQQVTTTLTDDDIPGITIVETDGSTNVAEGGATDTYTITLNTQPTDTVTVAIATGSQVNPITELTFNPTGANLWSTPQTVTVVANDDNSVEGTHTQTLRHTATSTDSNYNTASGLTIADVNVNINDNDIDYAIVSSGNLTEGDSGTQTARFTITRSGDLSVASRVNYAIVGTASQGSDYTTIGGDVTGITGTLNFAAAETTKTITVAVRGDRTVEAHESLSVSLSGPTAPGTATLTDSPARVVVRNDDAPGFRLNKTTARVNEVGSQTDRFTITLTNQPRTNVVFRVISEDVGEVLATPATLTFTPNNWNTPRTVNLRGVEDTAIDSNQTTAVIVRVMDSQSDDLFDGLADKRVNVTTVDEDTANTIATANPDTLTGTPGNDVIYSLAGNDVVYGLEGNDRLSGQEGNDTLWGGEDDDTLTGLDGNDELRGGPGNDRLLGGDGNDQLLGGDGNDDLVGGVGRDNLLGGAGNDTLAGGDGADTLTGDGGRDKLFGNLGNDLLNGGADNDELLGGDGSDRLNGDAGNDILRGGDGDDILDGGVGNDRLSGETGNDRITTGAGNDEIVIRSGHGFDRVTDFQNGRDRIALAGMSFGQLSIQQQNNDVLIRRGSERLLLLLNTNVGQINAADFT